MPKVEIPIVVPNDQGATCTDYTMKLIKEKLDEESKQEEPVPTEDAKAKKRGWVFDQLMIIGSFEAGMNHNDEQICNLYYELEGEEDEERITKLTNEIAQNREILDADYFARVDALNDLFDAMPNSDRHYYCQVKHRATTFILAAENYHARNGDAKAEETLKSAGKTLALTCSLAFGFEPMDCLRCLADSMAKVVPQLSMVEL